MNTNKFVDFYKKYHIFFKAAVMSLLPLLCCIITCVSQGQSIAQVYLPASEWNDELFYFKQVEGIVEYGYPLGYFGFNESHALRLSFAAWSPVLVFPWIIWGKIFGWGLLSPIYCNLFLMMLTLALYVLIVKPTNKQLGILTILYCVFPLFTRYILSGMPEVICFSLIIIFYAISVSFLDEEKNWKLISLFIISALLTLMRPYMILFLLLPMGLWIRRNKKKGIIGSIIILGCTGALYAAIKHYLGAEYFAPLFKTEWITTYFDKGIWAGIKYDIRLLYDMGTDFTRRTLQGFRSGLASGAFFAGYLAVMLILLWQTIQDWRKKRKNELILNGHLFFSFFAMLFALLLMYKLEEGSKHLLTFIAVGIFAISRMPTRYFKKAMSIGVLFAFLYIYRAVHPYDYQIPFATQEQVTKVEKWEQELNCQLILNKENVPNYDNVVIWVWNDIGQDKKLFEWQVLYGVPKGFGISCCESSYVIDNFEQLESKYIAATTGGTIDEMCQEANYKEINRLDNVVVYER